VQLQTAKSRFEAQGIKLAAISYDSPAILKDFTDRQKIDFPLLADPGSKVIRRFKVLNEKADGMTKGMALPGFFYIDTTGVVREKYFEANYVHRFTPNNVIAKLFPELTEEVSSKVEAPHLELSAGTIGPFGDPGQPRQPVRGRRASTGPTRVRPGCNWVQTDCADRATFVGDRSCGYGLSRGKDIVPRRHQGKSRGV
jgi:hypothetical protein